MRRSIKRPSTFSAKATLILLAALLVWVTFVHLAFSVVDGRSLPDHDYYNARPLLSAYRNILATHTIDSLIDGVKSYRTYYLHHTYFLGGIVYLTGIDYFGLRLFNLPFFLLMIVGVYATGRLLINRNFGLLCAFVIATLPLFDNFSRKTDLQFFAAVYLVWTNFFLLKIIRSPWKLRYSFFFGLTAGLAVMAHPIALLMLLPLGLALLMHTLSGRTQQEKRSGRFIQALGFSLLFAAPFLLKAVDYIVEKRAFVTGADVALPAAIRASIWTRHNLWEFFGPWFAVFFALVLLAAVIRFLLADKRDFISWYMLGAVIYYPVVSLVITINGAMTYDFMFLHALLIPLLLREAYLLFAEKWSDRFGQAVVFAALCLVVTAGVVEKNSVFRPLHEDAANDAYPNYTARRHILYRLDLNRQTIENMLRMTDGRRIGLHVRRLQPTDDGQFILEPSSDNDRQIFHFLETSAALYDLLLRLDKSPSFGWQPFEIVHCRFEKLVTAKEIARAILAIRTAWNDGRTAEWNYTVRRGTHATMPILTDSYSLMAVRRLK